MSNRVSDRALKSVAMAGILAAAAALSGCSTFSRGSFADPVVTGATTAVPQGNFNQSMPSTLGVQHVANGQFIPPENVGVGGGGYYSPPASNTYAAPGVMAQPNGPLSSISTQDLPVLSSNAPTGTQNPMSAQPQLAPVTVGPRTALSANPPSTAPSLVAVPSNAYVHVIAGGESLYTIARRYDVTTQAIVQANGFSSPDKISVGQKIVIPGRPDLLAAKGPAPSAGEDITQSPVLTTASIATPANQPAITNPNLLKTPETQPLSAQVPAQVQPPAAQKPAQVASIEPQVSGAEKFRWPVSGRVITDFSASKGTGINIEAPEGTAVRAAENGTVIYVGSGVEGYGNLVLIRHANGYVSAYAHLKSMSVGKGDTVNRGDNIGAAGMTGSVKRPQLHFELRKGATPVDPMPLLSS